MNQTQRHPAANVPADIKIKRGRIVFGLKDNASRGIEAVILPVFDIRNCSLAGLTRVIEQINSLPKRFQDNYCETLVKKSYGDMGTRFTIENGDLVALDEDAATQLFKLCLPIRGFRHYIPI
ncbi:hypothetical protein GW819_01560 [Candidatus Gracilibacteria bacterium]|nr:hypothetical protein [bacterium]NDK19506.1 hypothetical protein [Candidatus Gracilibacteria bacterium]OIO77588.1 MAG: hypothetical protein AUJ87_00995 [Candidatus Gracilibacteria bacterium CG1_02_38_174]PIQ10504.1 MAG: hypothetical protein COW68_04320 [Candidatus Gracilibacteria bacterium CG18_big_fil_WC_8_21_14_2_50_38_16]PIQ41721.1 MAG: hypothetical protein COW06_01985 [Candidatus Gracilibacteria bacterium CG12_big_fil_rev_8_21_14_0_65_38_15]PIZ01754.1 MAG: hypothetical protein COY60_0182